MKYENRLRTHPVRCNRNIQRYCYFYWVMIVKERKRKIGEILYVIGTVIEPTYSTASALAFDP